jgi:hypothetical protein
MTLWQNDVLQAEAIVELLGVCLRTTHFQQKDDMVMGSSLSTVSNIYMKHPEKLALDSAQHKSSLLLRYVGATFVVWPHGPEQLKNIISHFSSLRPSIQFTEKIESASAIALLDVMVIRKETTLATKVYRRRTQHDRYLSLNSNLLTHVKRGLIQSLHKRASTICQELQDLCNETSSLRSDLQLNGYPQGFIDSVINSESSSRPSREAKLCVQCIFHV